MAVTTAQVQQAYVAFFNRPADLAGLNYWTSSPAASVANLLDAFSKTPEYTSLYSNMNSTQLVNAVYQNLFGRAVESVDALNYWVGLLDKGTVTLGSIAATVADLAITNKTADGTLVSNKVAAATAFTTSLSTASNAAAATAYATANSTGLQAVKNWLAAVTSDASTLTNATSTTTLDSLLSTVKNNVASTGSTFTLTTGTDNIAGTSGNDTIIGEGNFTSVADQINGGAGVDTLKLYGTVIKPVISNIENIYLRAPNADFDVSTVAGVTSLEVDAEIGSRAFTVTTGQAVTLSNLQTTGQTQTIAGNTPASLNLTLNKVGKLDGTVTQTVALTGTSLNTVNLATSIADSAITLTNTPGKLATLNVTGDKAVTITESLAALKTIDASAATGNVVIKAGGAGNDLKMTGGSGNDAIWFNAGEFTNLDTIDLGTGAADKLVIAETSALTATQYTAINGYKGLEVLGLNASNVSVDASKLTAGIKDFAVESGNYTVTVTESLATTKYSLDNSAGNSGTLTITNKTGENATTLAIDNQSGANQTLATVVTTGISNVALSSTGNANAKNTLTTLTNADNSSIVVTGDRDLTITNALSATATGSKVDANAFTGKLSVLGSGKSDILIGGSGADTLDGGAVTHTVTAAPETAVVDFASGTTHAQNSTVILGGLTLTVNAAGGLTGDVIANAFANLANGATGTNSAGNYTFSGTLTGWSTGALANTDQITFTSSTAANVTDLGNTGTATLTGITKTDGVNGVNAVTGTVDTLTGNGGADTFAFSTADVATTAGAVTAIITDFKTGVDKIKVTNGADAGAGSATNYVEATSAASTLTALLTAADTALNGTVDYYVGQVGSDSYLVTDANGTGYTNVIKLTGVTLDQIAATDLTA